MSYSEFTIYPGFQPQKGYTLVYEDGNPKMMGNFFVCESESREIFLSELTNIFGIVKKDEKKYLILQNGTTIGPNGEYTIVKRLTSGSYGNIYRVIDKDLKNWVVKVQDLKTGTLEERYIKRLKGIPNVIQIEGSFTTPHFHFIVMKEYNSTLLSNKQRTTEQWFFILKKLIKALNSIHEKGIIHCDIKPENILMDGNTPVIADFGMAGERGSMGVLIVSWYFRHPDIAKKYTEIGDLKKAYYSQEFEKSPAVDIWALATSIFEAMTRKVLFYQCGSYREKYFFSNENQLYYAISHQESLENGILLLLQEEISNTDLVGKKFYKEAMIILLAEMLDSKSKLLTNDLIEIIEDKEVEDEMYVEFVNDYYLKPSLVSISA